MKALVETQVNGTLYRLFRVGTNFQWYTDEGKPTEIIRASIQAAKRALMHLAGSSLR